MAKPKFYTVWKGHQTGVFSSWEACKKQIDGFKGAQYKSFSSKKEAQDALSKPYHVFKGKGSAKKVLTASEKLKYGEPLLRSICVDAACSGNPGDMEYRGVLTDSKKEIFKIGPHKNGTNNIGEFLAIVHALALLKQKKLPHLPIYTDSRIAMSWVKKKECRTNIEFDTSNRALYDLILRAEKWLKENSYRNPILKWETKAWGEIPADFGRK